VSTDPADGEQALRGHDLVGPVDQLDGPLVQDRKFVVALARGLEVLRAFRAGEEPLSNHEIAGRTRLPRPTVTRLCYTLCRLGYLVHEDRGRYRLGPAMLAIAHAARANLGYATVAGAPMRALARACGGAVGLCTADRLSMLYIAVERSHELVTVQASVGDRVPISATASGRAYLAAVDADQRALLLSGLRLLDPLGVQSDVLDETVDRALDELARRGFVTAFGSWQADVNEVAVPFAAPGGGPHLALNCIGPASKLSARHMKNLVGPQLVELVEYLRQTLGTVRG
jgi:DNA-binding IclR family transcriptional regulator